MPAHRGPLCQGHRGGVQLVRELGPNRGCWLQRGNQHLHAQRPAARTPEQGALGAGADGFCGTGSGEQGLQGPPPGEQGAHDEETADSRGRVNRSGSLGVHCGGGRRGGRHGGGASCSCIGGGGTAPHHCRRSQCLQPGLLVAGLESFRGRGGRACARPPQYCGLGTGRVGLAAGPDRDRLLLRLVWRCKHWSACEGQEEGAEGGSAAAAATAAAACALAGWLQAITAQAAPVCRGGDQAESHQLVEQDLP
mmetsp:Transcript_128197/g.273353  ORF Transcript_128197/g.273353 Transcript_128197/m.273353 type:complete len:251 (+) Transcript_128197:309-1061(+)